MKPTKPYSPEVRERAVRMVFDHAPEYPSQWAAIQSIAEKIGCSGETLRHWVRQTERNQGHVLCRKLAVLLHRLWTTGERYEPLHNAGGMAMA